LGAALPYSIASLANGSSIMTKLLGLVTLTSAIALAGIGSAQPALAQQAAITNIDIEMSRDARKGSYGIRAEITNPNDFAVKNIQIRCTIVNNKGKRLKVYDSMILTTFPAKQTIVVPRLDIGAWPEQAARASCTSSTAQRV
jgi:hypothetical protein